jgi:Ca2+-binding EF-hand superfamily protein
MRKESYTIVELNKKMDANRNGFITRDEFIKYFKSNMGIELTHTEMNIVMANFDKNKDGLISIKEFINELGNTSLNKS